MLRYFLWYSLEFFSVSYPFKYYHTPQQRKIPNCKGKIEPQHMHVYHVIQKHYVRTDCSKHPFYAILACMPHQALCVHWACILVRRAERNIDYIASDSREGSKLHGYHS